MSLKAKWRACPRGFRTHAGTPLVASPQKGACCLNPIKCVGVLKNCVAHAGGLSADWPFSNSSISSDSNNKQGDGSTASKEESPITPLWILLQVVSKPERPCYCWNRSKLSTKRMSTNKNLDQDGVKGKQTASTRPAKERQGTKTKPSHLIMLPL